MSANGNAPIIIKRKKVVSGDGHHGGAWKVAYADFVTAMMAFFLLMWLLSSASETQKQGIADYFSPTVALNPVSGGGDGMFGGDSVFSQNTMAQNGTGASQLRAGSESAETLTPAEEDALAAQIAEVKALQDMQEILMGRGGESSVSELAMRHIVTRVTDEGLIIEVFDVPGATLFDRETDTPNPITQEIAAMLARILGDVKNPVAINGHLRSQGIVVRDNPIWDLSISRAARMRLMLEAGGLDPDRMARLTGSGDRNPVVPDSTAVRNNRIEITVLRSDR